MTTSLDTTQCWACKADIPEWVPCDEDDYSPPMCPECEHAEAQFHAQRDREEAEIRRTGLHLCPKCGQRALKITFTPTRQYGGGWDSFEQCSSCGHAEVYV